MIDGYPCTIIPGIHILTVITIVIINPHLLLKSTKQAEGGELRKATRDRRKQKRNAQSYEQVDLTGTPVLPDITSLKDDSKENTVPQVAQNGVHVPPKASQHNNSNQVQ
jgi:hypothetical protein